MSEKIAAPAIGIDLGTTYSCVAYWKNDRVEIIANDQGNRTTPSYVAFTDNDRLIGEGAYNQASLNPANTIFDAKRLIGRRFSEETVQNDMKLWPFNVISGKNDRPMICVNYKAEKKQFSPEEISSMVLTRMKRIAEDYIGSEVKDAVITVPAYFDQTQRQATIAAGNIAGINVLRVINEPTAAAIAYGLDNAIARKKNVLIFDLGGGTFDVALLTIEKDRIAVKAVGGDTRLGGEDFDNRLVKFFVAALKKKHDKDISGNPKALRRLRTACERAKRLLTNANETRIDIDALFDGIDFSASLSRSKFEEINADLFAKCIETVEKCLMDAKMDKKDVDDVVMVGGSSRIRKLQQMLRDLLNGKELCKNINPDEAVAYGAAVQAAMLSGQEKSEKIHDLVVVEVTSLSLGVETVPEVMNVLIPKNTPIPARRVRNFTTTKDYQTNVPFPVFEGERARSTDNRRLGELVVKGVQQAPRGVPKIDVIFDLQASGILNVFAVDKVTGAKSNMTINSERLSGEEIEMMTEQANLFKVDDEEYMKKDEARLAFERYACEMREKMKGESSSVEKRMAEDAIEKAFEWLDSMDKLTEVHVYEGKKDELMRMMNAKRRRND